MKKKYENGVLLLADMGTTIFQSKRKQICRLFFAYIYCVLGLINIILIFKHITTSRNFFVAAFRRPVSNRITLLSEFVADHCISPEEYKIIGFLLRIDAILFFIQIFLHKHFNYLPSVLFYAKIIWQFFKKRLQYLAPN